jgi:hypothetical protein
VLLISLIALFVSLLALLTLGWQTRLLRKTLEAGNYQSLIDKLLDVRNAVVVDASLGRMFEDNPQVQSVLDKTGMSISQFFWTLQFLTSWESFYQQRRVGLLGDQAWSAYKNSLKLAFATPQLKTFWLEFSQYSNYRSDWAEFVGCICNGVDPKDPILPKWSRMFRMAS